MLTRWQLVAVMLAAVSLSGCGGGGGADGNNTPPPETHSVSVSATGLSSPGLTLQLNGTHDLALVGNGTFPFPTALSTGSTYTVTVKTQPTTPPQTCVVSNATGTIGKADVTNVSVACTANSYAIAGQVNGLSGSGLVLQDNGGDDLPVTANGDFVFASRVRTGSAYSVSVKVQPTKPSQTCAVSNRSGTVGATDIGNVTVSCSTNSYSAGGTVSGLAGLGLVLQLNGIVDLPISANGTFTFPGELTSGSAYAITVKAQPTNLYQTCVTAHSSGVVGSGDVTDVSVSCTANSYVVGGSVTGLTGNGLVLQLNGGQDLPVGSDGSFVFPTPLASGSQYAVTVKTQTSTYRERCVAANASGVIGGSSVSTVTVDCTVVLGFVYVVGNNGQVFGYGIHPQTGALLPLGSTVSTDSSALTLVAAPNGATLYAANFSTDTISVFAVDSSSGTLSEVSAPVSTGPSFSRPESIAIAPSGKFLYVGNVQTGNVTMFSIHPVTGALSGLTVAASLAGIGRMNLALTPDGAFLYVLRNNNMSPTLSTYSVDAMTGALTAVATIAPGPVNTGLAIDPLGRFLYVHKADFVGIDTRRTTILPFSIDSGTGALTPVGSGTAVLSNGAGFVINPTGQYAYLLDSLQNTPTRDNHIDAFSIDQSSGALTSIGTPTLLKAAPDGIVCDPSGKFVFVGNHANAPNDPSATWYDVSGFTIGATGPTAGQLSPAGHGAPHTGFTSGNSPIAVIE